MNFNFPDYNFSISSKKLTLFGTYSCPELTMCSLKFGCTLTAITFMFMRRNTLPRVLTRFIETFIRT